MAAPKTRTKIAFAAPKAAKVVPLCLFAPLCGNSVSPELRLFNLYLPLLTFFNSKPKDVRRDGCDPSHGTGQNSKTTNVYAAWDGVTGPEGVKGGLRMRSTASHFIPELSGAIRSYLDQNRIYLQGEPTKPRAYLVQSHSIAVGAEPSGHAHILNAWRLPILVVQPV